MKRLFLMFLLSLLLCAALLSACAPADLPDDPGDLNGSNESTKTDRKIPQMSDQEMNTPLGEDHTGMTPGEIKVITDQAMKEQYGITDLSHYKFKAYQTNLKVYRVTYDLYIQGYHTYEVYSFILTPEGMLEHTSASGRGEYSRYLGGATEERMAAAVADIEKKASAYDEQGPYWLEIDSEGYLCLCLELIVDIPYNENIACGDHKHVFFRSRVCGPDQ
jgi:hypothetical protein